jgi:hypothetical protein
MLAAGDLQKVFTDLITNAEEALEGRSTRVIRVASLGQAKIMTSDRVRPVVFSALGLCPLDDPFFHYSMQGS